MVSNIGLCRIQKGLYEIFGCPISQPFANLSIIIVGDLLQLPPVNHPKYLKNIIEDLVTFEICGHCS